MADDLDALTTSLRADPRDPITIQALADWLEEKGAAPESVRALTVDGPTVLVVGLPPDPPAELVMQIERNLEGLKNWLYRESGQPMAWLTVPHGTTIRTIKASQAEASGGK